MSELSVLGTSAVHDFAESFTEVVRKKGVQDWVNTGIHIGQDMTHDLDHDARVGDLVPVDTLQYQDQLQADITKLLTYN
jgi:hypothetical protein